MINTNGFKSIAEGLKINGSLMTLDLSENRMLEQGATFIKLAIIKNRCLQNILMSNCVLYDKGAYFIFEALCKNFSIS